jgi:hypothetical protein
MEITGKLFSKLEETKGESSRGPWQKGGFVLETEGTYPKKICCVVWGDMLNQVNNLNEGDTVKASIDIESREYNGRWYTDVKAWKIESSSGPIAGTGPQTGATEGPASGPEDSVDDLPF